jgi:subtilisin family serine protease
MTYVNKRELVVIVKPEVRLRVGLAPIPKPTMSNGDVSPLRNLLQEFEGIKIRPLFGASEERLKAATAVKPVAPISNATIPDLSVFYQVEAPEELLDELAERFRQMNFVEAAYVRPPIELPYFPVRGLSVLPAEPPTISPNFTSLQDYLDAAPGGIDAKFAWTISGGRGTNVNIIDIERDWLVSHEDLFQNLGGLISGSPSGTVNDRNHGTAVLGVIGGDDNGFGITGIAPDAYVRCISPSLGFDAAIKLAADILNPGDIILLEAQVYGPRYNFQPSSPSSQLGMIPVQYYPATYAAITYATVIRGVIVVEAAGNGSEDLDDPLYSIPQPQIGILVSPFNRNIGDNASIIVGAGAPPIGTNGIDNGPDRSRLAFSNFGSCVDVQGWGAEVMTCGYGNKQGGSDERFWYTDKFGGTSAASPMVVGALACIQGILKATGKPLLTPIAARQLLQNNGSVQQSAPGRPSSQRIGNRPNLFLAIAGL